MNPNYKAYPYDENLEQRSDYQCQLVSFSKTRGDTFDETQQPSFFECGKSDDQGVSIIFSNQRRNEQNQPYRPRILRMGSSAFIDVVQPSSGFDVSPIGNNKDF